jgi:hypothetical protein
MTPEDTTEQKIEEFCIALRNLRKSLEDDLMARSLLDVVEGLGTCPYLVWCLMH